MFKHFCKLSVRQTLVYKGQFSEKPYFITSVFAKLLYTNAKFLQSIIFVSFELALQRPVGTTL